MAKQQYSIVGRGKPRLFNNCHRRNHIERYGDDAFFDLGCEGSQADLATDLEHGEQCIVATQNETRDIAEFIWFSFDRETKDKCKETGECVRVQRGKRIKSEEMKKTLAAKTKKYGVFFNKLSHFKRQSVIVY